MSDKPLNRVIVNAWCHEMLLSLEDLFENSNYTPQELFGAVASRMENNSVEEGERILSDIPLQYICWGLYHLRTTESSLAADQFKHFVQKIQEAEFFLSNAIRFHHKKNQTNTEDDLP